MVMVLNATFNNISAVSWQPKKNDDMMLIVYFYDFYVSS